MARDGPLVEVLTDEFAEDLEWVQPYRCEDRRAAIAATDKFRSCAKSDPFGPSLTVSDLVSDCRSPASRHRHSGDHVANIE